MMREPVNSDVQCGVAGVFQRTTLALLIGAFSGLLQAQGVAPTPLPGVGVSPGVGAPLKPSGRPLGRPDAGPLPWAEPANPADAEPKPNARFDADPVRAERVDRSVLAPGAAASAPTEVPRTWSVEPSITARAIASDNSRLGAGPGTKKKDIQFELSPQVALRAQGPRLRLDSVIGLEQVSYLKDSYDSRLDPRLGLNLNAALVENFLFLDAAAQIDRRAATPFGVQSASFDTAQKVRTKYFRLSPYIAWRPEDAWRVSLRSDNDWTRRSGSDVSLTARKVYSQNSVASVAREPQPLGASLELRDQSLRYNDESSVIHLQNALLALGYAIDPQLVVYALGGSERSSFAKAPGLPITTRTDSDTGVRVRWAPLERSVVTAEARQRFFGTGYDLQWNHRSTFFALRLQANREPNTQPEQVRLAGDLVGQLDAIFRSRGFNAAQRQSLVRGALNEYALPDNLTDPTNVYLSRAQLSTNVGADLTLLGRRTVTVLSVYRRKLEQLRRSGESRPAFADAGEVDQRGAQVLATFRLTPTTALEAAYRYDRAQGLGFNTQNQTKQQLYGLGTKFALSPSTSVALGVQHLSLKSTGLPIQANSASLGMTHRF
jgi:uncharacterized protein (PEP-CTERM system associated)